MGRIVARPAWNDRNVGLRIRMQAQDQRQLRSTPPTGPECRSDCFLDHAEGNRVRRVHLPLLQDDAINEHGPASLEKPKIAELVKLIARPLPGPRAGWRRDWRRWHQQRGHATV